MLKWQNSSKKVLPSLQITKKYPPTNLERVQLRRMEILKEHLSKCTTKPT